MRRILALILSLSAGLVASLVAATADATPRLDVAHVQGRDAPWVVGWNEAVITLDNADGAAWRGEVAIDASYERNPDSRPSVRVPVSLAAGESARLLVPFHLQPGTFPNVILRTGSEEVGTVALTLTRPIEGVATIVEIQGKEARGPKLVDVPPASADEGEEAFPSPSHGPLHGPKGVHPYVPPPIAPPPSWGSAPIVQVTTVQIARESGDPILADVAGGWSGAVLVVAPSDIVSRLSGRALDALEHYVLSGGTLVLSVTREEDLRSPVLKTFLGGEARMTSASGGPTQTFGGAGLARGDVSKDGDDGDFVAHGLGEVWLLRRDPWSRAVDAKPPKTIFALWSRARVHRTSLMSLPAGTGLRWYDDDRVRKFLDPNHGFRPALGIAAFFVVIYALLVGPAAFGRARKLGRPLSVLQMTPILALAMFALLVGLGKFGKGFRGRARRLQIVDVAGGATHGSSTAFHAFYVADPSVVEVVAARPIDTVHAVEPFVENASIDIDKGAIAVRAVRAHPWQTIVVQEEGGKEIPGGIVLEGNGPRLTLINNTPWTLEHVVLHPETSSAAPARSSYFGKVPPGAKVTARDGTAVDRRLRVGASPYGSSDGPLGTGLVDKDHPSLEAADAFDAIVTSWASASFPPGEALPFHIPVATAIVRPTGGSISGLSIEREAILIRVVGLGGGKGKGELEKEEPKGKETQL